MRRVAWKRLISITFCSLNQNSKGEMNRKKEMKILQNKVAVITGGSGVLGAEMSRALAAKGAKVVVLGRNGEKAERLAAELQAQGGIAMGISADVCDENSMLTAKEAVNSVYGPVDLLINGAGGNHPKGTTALEYYDKDEEMKTFFGLDPEGIRHVLDLNYMGTLIPSKVFASDMINRAGGTIINISSMSAFTPLTKVMAYSGSKAAINNLTQWLAVHFAKAGIRVNAIAPGFFLTEQNRTLLTNPDGSLTDRSRKILSQTPMGRFGEPADLISTLLWLCDPASAFVTGIVVPVDGGFSAYSGV